MSNGVIVAGDTCDKVMMGAGINDTMLYTNNPQIDDVCSNIYIGKHLIFLASEPPTHIGLIGEVLCVANTSVSPAEVEGRLIGTTGGEPAGPPAQVPYPAAKHHKASPESSTSSSAAPTPTPTPTPAPGKPYPNSRHTRSNAYYLFRIL